MQAILSTIDRISTALVFICTLMLVALVAISLSEVFARYVLNSPTLWAYDMVNFCNGALLTMAAAYAQKNGAHVAIDVFSRSFPPRFAELLLAAMIFVLALPTLGLLAYEATLQAWKFYQSGRILESAWKPVRWPFYVPITLGLWALWLQCIATVVRLIQGQESVPGQAH